MSLRRDLFIGAQALVLDDAMAELRTGRKRTHWIWCVFPQMHIGSSYRSELFALMASEAREYAHDLELGPRLLNCMELALALDDARAALGSLDALKLRSSMTLFAVATDIGALPRLVVNKHFNGELCHDTCVRLGRGA